jgi:hypothetical protein
MPMPWKWYGAILVGFPNAMALIEGTWTTLDHGGPTSIVHGTTGTLPLERQEGREVVRIGRGGGESEIVDPEPLPEGRATIAGNTFTIWRPATRFTPR